MLEFLLTGHSIDVLDELGEVDWTDIVTDAEVLLSDIDPDPFIKDREVVLGLAEVLRLAL